MPTAKIYLLSTFHRRIRTFPVPGHLLDHILSSMTYVQRGIYARFLRLYCSKSDTYLSYRYFYHPVIYSTTFMALFATLLVFLLVSCL